MSVLELRNARCCQLQYFSCAKPRLKHLQLKFKMKVFLILLISNALVCRYHYFRGTCCYLHHDNSAALRLVSLYKNGNLNSSKYETIICICMCPVVLRVFFYVCGVCVCVCVCVQAKQVQGLP
jgi:hypothetical protein